MMMEIGILLLGILAGVMSGLFGIGGGIVMVPMLIAFFGLDMLNANAASLAAMLLPVGVFGVINFYKAGYINLKVSLWISLGLFAGSFVGAELAMAVNIGLLSKLYAVFLLYVAVSYMSLPERIARWRKKTVVVVTETTETRHFSIWMYVVMGIFAGIIAGLFGKGGGIIIVPLLVKIFKYNPKAASATSLAALQLPVGLPSVWVYAQQGYLNYMYAAFLAIGIVMGAFFGSKLALKLPSAYFKKIYAVFLLGVAVYMVYKYI